MTNKYKYHLLSLLCFLFNNVVFAQQDAQTALYSPNAYMAVPGSILSIPVKKAFSVWNHFPALQAMADLSGTVAAELLWQDTPGLISGLQLENEGENAIIRVSTNSAQKRGNAVVGVKIGGAIRWSWHIWVTNYSPAASNLKYVSEGKETTCMSINLGATGESADAPASFGLLYQYGRNNPFPQAGSAFPSKNYSSEGDTIYDINNTILNEGTEGVSYEKVTEPDNLIYAINKPLTFYMGNAGNGYDWYSSASIHNDTLWSGTTGNKGIFDPSPEGWRVPPVGQLDSTSAYPRTGSRDYASGSFFMTGDYGMYWSATANNSLTYYMFLSQPLVDTKSSHYRSNGYAIRCVRDINYSTGIFNPAGTKSAVNITTVAKTIVADIMDNSLAKCQVFVYNSNGTLVSTATLGAARTVIATNVNPGVYIVKITGQYNCVNKIIVQ